ncbi:response regulator [Cohnella kolymensis]|uniref:response regulator n=1 Tax=Cohnella kolymensis TaxID=1590652 RepID=UPI0009E5935A|nr:response regulator [Cohnella kolymensis]
MIKVMIVEDDPMVAEFNGRYLERVDGFRLVASASSVKESLDLLQTHDVELILLDIFMPGKSGLELLSYIRKTGKAIDVIVISAACDMQSVKKAMRYGAVDYLIKPFEFDRFQAALASYREEVRFMENQQVLSQAELDKRLFFREPAAGTSELPKGLTRTTLKLIWDHVQQLAHSPFSTDELAARVGVSRISVRKYIHFLNEIDILVSEINYGSIGRPVFKHKYNEAPAKPSKTICKLRCNSPLTLITKRLT